MKGRFSTPILDFNMPENEWTPPEICESDYVARMHDELRLGHSDQYYIFQTEPFIDSIYVEYDLSGKLKGVRRFTFHEGFRWAAEDEKFFVEHCVKEERGTYNGGAIDEIFDRYGSDHPEWNLKRYYTRGLRVLDHIYNCMMQNSAKGLLYRAGLDELAVHLDEVDEINFLAASPSELFDNISENVLQSLNCPCGILLLADRDIRNQVRALGNKYPRIFRDRLNDAQCRYIKLLLDGNYSLGETCRLFESKREELADIKNEQCFEVYISAEKWIKEQRAKRKEDIRNICGLLEKIDPIYYLYIRKRGYENLTDDHMIETLEYYLIKNRDKFDKAIRQSNKRREYIWEDTDEHYCITYPKTTNDLLREEVYLRYGWYSIYDVIANRATVLFMHETSHPSVPYIMLEICDGELECVTNKYYDKPLKLKEIEWIKAYCDRHGVGYDMCF